MVDPHEGGDSVRGQATRLLRRLREGDARAFEELMPLVYETLHGLAGRMMSGERAGHTLQPTALVNEAWMRMIHQQDVDWQDRDHFLRLAARTMRRVLVDHARARGRAKRGGDRVRCDLDGDLFSVRGDSQLLVEFDEALAQLEAMDEQLARIVELRFFGGHTIEEAARLLGVSHGTVERGWSVARLWLARSLDEHGCD